MSEENVEIVRRLIDAVNRNDPAGLDLFAPNAEIQDYPGLPDAGWHHGPEGALAWLRRLYEAFGGFRLDIERSLDAGNRVLIDWHASGSGRRVGVPLSLRGSTLFTLRDGKIVRSEVFATRKEAAEAAGLAE